MSRTRCEIKSLNNEENEKRIISILNSKGYERKVKNNEIYYKQGNGLLTASKCIKYIISDNQIIFEAWVNNWGFIESNLKGFMGVLPKKQCKKTLDLIINSMESQSSHVQSNSLGNIKTNNKNIKEKSNKIEDIINKPIKNAKNNIQNESDELKQSIEVNKSIENVENNIEDELLEDKKSIDNKKNMLIESKNSIYCSKCGTVNPENSRFCNSCGHDLKSFPQTKCPNCGTINPKNSRFCNSCGENLAGQIFGISYHLFGYILKVIIFIMGIVSISFTSEYEYVYTFEGCISSLIYLIFAYILLFYMGYVTYKKLSSKIHIIILDILALISIFISLCIFITEGSYLFNDLQIGFIIIGIPLILFALYIIAKELTKSKADKTTSVFNNVKKEESKKIIHYFEKDNKGDRHDTISKANGYWLGQRLQMVDKSQFTLFIFNNATDAETALLELPFIHKAEDTGNLICDRLFQFGYYKVNDNIYEAIICGFDLTLDEFNNVEKTFLKHKGKRKNSLEPSSSVNKETISVGDASNVKFIETYKYEGGTYECYEANSKDDAIAFLNTKEVTEKFYYIHVKTHNGVIGKDINGTYKI